MRSLVIFCCLVCLSHALEAQEAKPDSTLTNQYLLDFSVPDMPADKALGTNPSNILAPSDIKKFAAALSPFLSNGQGVIPKNFAMAVAPWKLASKTWTLGKYAAGWNRLLYNSSFSLATNKDTTKYSSKLAFGYHFSIPIGKGDILIAARVKNGKIKSQFQSKLWTAIDRPQSLYELQKNWFLNIANYDPKDLKDSLNSAAKTKEFDAFLQLFEPEGNMATFHQKYPNQDTVAWKKLYNPIKDYKSTAFTRKAILDSMNKEADTLIAAYQDSFWNAGRIDFALAWVGQSRDSLIKQAEFGSMNLWLTMAGRLGRRGQILVGASATLPRQDTIPKKTNFAYTGNVRVYWGTSSFKGFIETQYKRQNYDSLHNSLLFNVGAELKLGGSFWVDVGGGINNYLGLKSPLSQFVSSLSIRYGFNKPK